MKKFIFILFIVLNSAGFALEDLKCTSSEGYTLTANLQGFWMSNIVFSRNSKVIEKHPSTYVPEKSYHQWISENFATTRPYPTYSFSKESTQYMVAFPDEDLRNDKFIGLLFTDDEEIELNCVTKTIK